MTIPTTIPAAGPFNTDGVATQFPFTYKSFGASMHRVKRITIADGSVATLTYGADYSVVENVDQDVSPGGNVVISPALPAGYTISIYSNATYEQPVDLPTGGPFFAMTVEDALDRIVTLLKQLVDTDGALLPSDRALRVPVGEAINEFPAVAFRPNTVMIFDNLGQAAVATLAQFITNLTNIASNGLRDIPRRTSGWARGECLAASAGVTLNTSDMAAGYTFSLYNDSGSSITLTQGSGVTLRLAGTATTGNLTLAARGMATIWCNSGTEAIAIGAGLS